MSCVEQKAKHSDQTPRRRNYGRRDGGAATVFAQRYDPLLVLAVFVCLSVRMLESRTHIHRDLRAHHARAHTNPETEMEDPVEATTLFPV